MFVDFYLNPEFNDEPAVRPDDKVAMRLIHDIQAAGLAPRKLAANLDKAYLTELRSPDALVHVKNSLNRLVFVQGQVTKPGSFPLESGMTVLQAVADAAGVTPEAAREAVLIRRNICGQPRGMKIDISNAQGKVGDSPDLALMPHILVVPCIDTAAASAYEEVPRLFWTATIADVSGLTTVAILQDEA